MAESFLAPASNDDPEAMPEIVLDSIGVAIPIAADRPLPPLPAIPRGNGVVNEGRAPIRRYALPLHRLHGSPTAAIAVYDPRLGAVVVASHDPEFREGQVLDVDPSAITADQSET